MVTPSCAERSATEVLETVAAILAAADVLGMIITAVTVRPDDDDGGGRGPQSKQSSPKLHKLYSEPAPPSSQSPSLACVQVSAQPPEGDESRLPGGVDCNENEAVDDGDGCGDGSRPGEGDGMSSGSSGKPGTVINMSLAPANV